MFKYYTLTGADNNINPKDFYVDMEGKLRNDKDQFDLIKCEEVLKIVEYFISLDS